MTRTRPLSVPSTTRSTRGVSTIWTNIATPDFVFYHQVDTPHAGVDGFRESEEKNFAAFDDWQMPIVDLIAEGDQVASYMIFEGIHARDWAGIPASGRKLRFSLFMKLTLRDGLIVEKRAHFDRADIRQQLAG